MTALVVGQRAWNRYTQERENAEAFCNEWIFHIVSLAVIQWAGEINELKSAIAQVDATNFHKVPSVLFSSVKELSVPTKRLSRQARHTSPAEYDHV